jgi:hypothetical protein
LRQFTHGRLGQGATRAPRDRRKLSPFVRPALVNGDAGVVVTPGGQPFSVMSFIVRRGRIADLDD